MTPARAVVRALAAGIVPADGREAADRDATLRWIDSGAPLFRIAKPATPDRHLCAYSGLVDDTRGTVLLVDHVKAGLWLPPGGHVDDGEDPRDTALREAEEELGVDARFHPRFGAEPVLLSVSRTRGADSHTDVTFWFVLDGREDMPVVVDAREARQVRWFPLSEPAPPGRADPRMDAFRRKVSARQLA
jgi:8-oxo-dGTP pyrophosphatase MutT (NUDIX family)